MNGPRIVQMNLENLFVLIDRAEPDSLDQESLGRLTERQWQALSSSNRPNKPLRALRDLAQNIEHLQADLLILSEIGGPESLATFNQLFLGNQFQPLCLESNSDRGIDLGFLLRRSAPFEAEMQSHRDRPLHFLYPHELETKARGYGHLPSARRQTHFFSRDVLELVLKNPRSGQVQLRVFAVHLKSRLDRDRIDPEGRDRRRAEVNALVEILTERNDAPIVLAGDFNGFARPSSQGGEDEFSALCSSGLVSDVLEVAGLPVEERFTHVQFWGRRTGVNQQLDYIFISPELTELVDPDETYIFRFIDQTGKYRSVPRNLNEKRSLPSDHYPVVLKLKRWP